jgi:anti-anti-sigma factor
VEGAMEIEVLPVEGGGRGYILRGDFDLDAIPALERLLFNGDSSIPVVLETSGLTFMDSTGLWILLRLAHAGDGAVPGVIVRNPSQIVRRLINLAIPSGVDGLEVQFRGSGPGAAHRLTELVRATRSLMTVTAARQEVSRRLCFTARRTREESAEARRLRAAA